MQANRFHTKMVKYLYEYQEYLILDREDGTGASHVDIVHEFINYLYNHHLIVSFDQITVSMANSKFLAYFNRVNKTAMQKEEMKEILYGFFTFLYGKHGIRNEKLMRGFGKV